MDEDISVEDLRSLSQIRYEIRAFLAFSEQAAKESGIEARQYQLLLAIKGLPSGLRPTIGTLAERMQIRHHSMVELVDRSEASGLVKRRRNEADRREVEISLTPRGEQHIVHLARVHRDEMLNVAPRLVETLQGLIERARKVREEG